MGWSSWSSLVLPCTSLPILNKISQTFNYKTSWQHLARLGYTLSQWPRWGAVSPKVRMHGSGNPGVDVGRICPIVIPAYSFANIFLLIPQTYGFCWLKNLIPKKEMLPQWGIATVALSWKLKVTLCYFGLLDLQEKKIPLCCLGDCSRSVGQQTSSVKGQIIFFLALQAICFLSQLLNSAVVWKLPQSVLKWMGMAISLPDTEAKKRKGLFLFPSHPHSIHTSVRADIFSNSPCSFLGQ